MFMGSTLRTPFYVVYRDLFGFSDLTLTVVGAVYAGGNLVALFLLGRLSDQLGRKVRRQPVESGAIQRASVTDPAEPTLDNQSTSPARIARSAASPTSSSEAT